MEFLNELDPLLQKFWYIALFSSVLFAIQSIMTFVGSDAMDGADADFDSDFEDTATPFQLFTFRNLVNFLLGFGWGGVSFFETFSSKGMVIFIAVVMGLLFVGVFFLIIQQVKKLAEDNSFKLSDTINKTGEVYLTIPEKNSGTGKILVSVKGSMHELAAITPGEKLNKGTVIKIKKIEGDNMLSVEAI